MSEPLGEGVFDLTADLGPLVAKVAAGKEVVRSGLNDMAAYVERFDAKIVGAGEVLRRTFLNPLERDFIAASLAAAKFGNQIDQLDGSLRALSGELADVARNAQRMSDELLGAFAAVQDASHAAMRAIVSDSAAEVHAVNEVTRAYYEQAAAARLAKGEQAGALAAMLSASRHLGGWQGPQSPYRVLGPAGGYYQPRPALMSGPSEPVAIDDTRLVATLRELLAGGALRSQPVVVNLIGSRGPTGVGGPANPEVVTLEAGSTAGLGARAAAIGASPTGSALATATGISSSDFGSLVRALRDNTEAQGQPGTPAGSQDVHIDDDQWGQFSTFLMDVLGDRSQLGPGAAYASADAERVTQNAISGNRDLLLALIAAQHGAGQRLLGPGPGISSTESGPAYVPNFLRPADLAASSGYVPNFAGGPEPPAPAIADSQWAQFMSLVTALGLRDQMFPSGFGGREPPMMLSAGRQGLVPDGMSLVLTPRPSRIGAGTMNQWDWPRGMWGASEPSGVFAQPRFVAGPGGTPAAPFNMRGSMMPTREDILAGRGTAAGEQTVRMDGTQFAEFVAAARAGGGGGGGQPAGGPTAPEWMPAWMAALWARSQGAGGAGPAQATTFVPLGGPGGGGGGGLVPPVAVGGPGASGGGGGGGVPPWLVPLLWGRGGGGGGGRGFGRGPLWWLGGLTGVGAGMGSIGSLAGLGPEHLIMTLLGIGGSAAAGVAGAGTLAAGAAGQFAVGGGSDIAVLKSTITDTQQLAKAQDQVIQAQETLVPLQNQFTQQLQKTHNQLLIGDWTQYIDATRRYGANSAQASVAASQLYSALRTFGDPILRQGFNQVVNAQQNVAVAQANVNTQMTVLGNTAGVKAEAGLAKATNALNVFWDQQTSAARVQAVKILSQVVQLGHDYVPLVAQAAQQNLAIINQGLKPLFAWLEGPQGMGIWQNLENNFKRNLPSAIHAFDQAMEVMLRFVSIASNYTGGFTAALDRMFTRLNNKPDATLQSWVERLVGDFRLWEQFIKALTKDIYYLFKQDAGTGSSIIATLTQMLDKLGAWETSTRGTHQLHTIFEVHKEEVLALLHTFPALFSTVGQFYLHVAPPLTKAMTTIIEAIAGIVNGLSKLGPLVDNLLAMALLSAKLGLLGSALRGIGGALGLIRAEGAGAAAATAAVAVAGAPAAVSAEAAAAARGWSMGGAALMGERWTRSGVAGEAAATSGILGRFGLTAMGASLASRVAGGLPAAVTGGAEFAPVLAASLAPAAVGVLATGAGVLGGSVVQHVTGLRSNTLGTAAGGVGGAAVGAGIGTLLGGPVIGTAIGAGIGATLGPTIGHLLGSLFGGRAGADYGKQFATGFLADMRDLIPRQALPRFQDQIARTVDSYNQARSTLNQLSRLGPTPAEPANALGRGAAPGALLPSAASERRKMAKDAFSLGWETGNAAVSGLQSVQHPTTYEFLGDFERKLMATRPYARNQAARVMLEYAASLEANGRLPKGSVKTMIASLEAEFPSLTGYLRRFGMSTDQQMSAAMQFKGAQNTLVTTLQNMRTQWGMLEISTKVTGQNMWQNMQTAMNRLYIITKTTTGQTRDDALAALKQLHDQAAAYFASMTAKSIASVTAMRDGIQSGSKQAAASAETNFSHIAMTITNAMGAGAETTAQAANEIAAALNATLQAFGAAKLPLAALDPKQKLASVQGYANWFFHGSSTSGQAGAHATGAKVSTPTYVVGEEGSSHPEYVLATNPAYRQRNVKLWVQAARDLEIPGFVKGGYTGYSLPLPRGSMMPGSWSIDQGVDIPAGAGTPEFAIGPGVIVQEGIGGFGPNAPVLLLTAGPLAGRSVYYGHAGPDTVRVGQSVRAGQQISSVGAGIVGISTGPHIEFGFYPPGSMGAGAQMAQVLSQLMGGAGVTGVGVGGIGTQIPTIKDPTIRGAGTIAEILRGGLKKVTNAANQYLQTHLANMIGVAGVSGVSTAGLSGSLVHIVNQIAARKGWSGQVQDWLNVIQAESGGSMTARNPSSGAYGIAQFISGPGEYAKYGGNVSTLVGQLVAMANYIAQRYGGPGAAWAHETSAGWYRRGGIPTLDFAGSFSGGGTATATRPTMALFGDKGAETAVFLPHSQLMSNATNLQSSPANANATIQSNLKYPGEPHGLSGWGAYWWAVHHGLRPGPSWYHGGHGSSSSSSSTSASTPAKKHHNPFLTDVLEFEGGQLGSFSYGATTLRRERLPVGHPIDLMGFLGRESPTGFGHVRTTFTQTLRQMGLGSLLDLADAMSKALVRREDGKGMEKLHSDMLARQRQAERLRHEADKTHGTRHRELLNHAARLESMAGKDRQKLQASSTRNAELTNLAITQAATTLKSTFTAQQTNFQNRSSLISLLQGLAVGTPLSALGLGRGTRRHPNPLLRALGLSHHEAATLVGSGAGTVTGLHALESFDAEEVAAYTTDLHRLRRLYADALRTHNKKLEKSLLDQMSAVDQALAQAITDKQQAYVNEITQRAQTLSDQATAIGNTLSTVQAIQGLTGNENLGALGLSPAILKILGIDPSQAQVGSALANFQTIQQNQGGTLTSAQIAAAKAAVDSQNTLLTSEESPLRQELGYYQSVLPTLTGSDRTNAISAMQALAQQILGLQGSIDQNNQGITALTQATNANTAATTNATGAMTGSVTYQYGGQNWMASDMPLNLGVGG